MLNAFEAVIWAAWKAGYNTSEILAVAKKAERNLRVKWSFPIDEGDIYNTLSRLKERDYRGEMVVSE